MISSTVQGLNQTLRVTNQTSKSVIFANVQDSDDSGQDAYAQPLSAFPDSVKPTDVAAKGGTATLTLDQSNMQNYNLIGMRAEDLFPVANRVAVVPIDCSSHPSDKCSNGTTAYYDDLTVTQAEADGVWQAFQFYQSISAFPGTDMSLNFIKLLSTYKTDPLNLETAVNAFFQQTKGYEQCTLESYIAASTYAQNYAFAWANLQTSFTYAVFQAASDPKATGALVDVGKLVLTKKTNAPNPADVRDRNGGFDIVYQPNSGNSLHLNLVDGNLVSDNSTTPAVTLFLSYGLKSDFTGVNTDSVAWPLLIGKANGVQVIAVGVPDVMPPVTSQADTKLRDVADTKLGDVNINVSDWTQWIKDRYTNHPDSVGQWFEVVGLTAGFAIAGLGLLGFIAYKLVKRIKQEEVRNGEPPNQNPPAQNPPSPEQIAEWRTKYEAALEQLGLDDKTRFGHADVNFDHDRYPTLDNQDEIAIDVGQRTTDYFVTQERNAFADACQMRFDNIKLLSEYGITEPIQEGMQHVVEVRNLVKQIDSFDSANRLRPDILHSMEVLKENVSDAFEAARASMIKEARDMVRGAEDAANFRVEVTEDFHNNAKEINDGENPIEPESIIE